MHVMTDEDSEYRSCEMLIEAHQQMVAEKIPDRLSIPSFVTMGALLAVKTGGSARLREAVSAMAEWHQRCRVGDYPPKKGSTPPKWRAPSESPNCVACGRAIQYTATEIETGLCGGCIEIVLIGQEIIACTNSATEETMAKESSRIR